MGHRADMTTTEPTLQIQNVAVAPGSLTIDYMVSNPFEDDIWVCEDIDIADVYGCEATTTIEGQTLVIRRRINLRANYVYDTGPTAEYRRLSPRASRQARLTIGLPACNSSPVYDFRPEERGTPTPVTLYRAVLEVGYFPGWFVRSQEAANKQTITRDRDAVSILQGLARFLDIERAAREMKEAPADSEGKVSVPAIEVREEIHEGTSNKAVYVHFLPFYWEDRRAERVARAVLEDVVIPCCLGRTQGPAFP